MSKYQGDGLFLDIVWYQLSVNISIGSEYTEIQVEYGEFLSVASVR